jgi:hypothetical protein
VHTYSTNQEGRLSKLEPRRNKEAWPAYIGTKQRCPMAPCLLLCVQHSPGRAPQAGRRSRDRPVLVHSPCLLVVVLSPLHPRRASLSLVPACFALLTILIAASRLPCLFFFLFCFCSLYGLYRTCAYVYPPFIISYCTCQIDMSIKLSCTSCPGHAGREASQRVVISPSYSSCFSHGTFVVDMDCGSFSLFFELRLSSSI